MATPALINSKDVGDSDDPFSLNVHPITFMSFFSGNFCRFLDSGGGAVPKYLPHGDTNEMMAAQKTESGNL